jgi:hypothetical protein
VGFHSLTTTTQNSGQQSTARLSARRVSVAGGNRAQDPLVRDTTILVILEDAVVIFLHITEDHCLNDLLHITQFSSKWQFFCEGPRSRCYGRTAALRLIVQPCDEDD